ncbi:hypothetical protein [Actinomycetospora sp. TBRC 11914]|uniref:hypothetical protein n=1 Tax=Actinomycetospora sp. TBRC 11914 TaxID=2729387 RepID=UPI00145F69F0|nr:hypothetical protein [Actinomycetospora sp. TBRC 11914]NMO89354.1 hypothetical protein [Actinomycetospora sp. TBRC 11914]
MSTIHESDPGTATQGRKGLPWWAFGIANVVIVLVVSVLLWWLLVDPQWSPVGSYPQPFEAALFWSVIATVWIAFNCGWTGPASLPQPTRGLVGIVVVLVVAALVTVLLAFGWGAIDPSFAASRAEGAGFTMGQLIVLFAFFFYVTAAINWMHWPWAGRLEQPWLGLAEIGALVLPTLVVYGVLAVPNVATWADKGTALIETTTLIGWFYSLIVSVVITGLLWENRPWSLAGTPGRVAALSFVGNIVFGTVLYFVVGGLARLLMGPANVAALGDGVTEYAAELGVCWVFWMIAWGNVFGNKPTHLGAVANDAVRFVVTLVLGALTFLAYYFSFAGTVLHEPAAGTSLHGDALGFMDLAVLITLFYVLFLGSAGLPAPDADAAEADAETIAVETGEAAKADARAEARHRTVT